MLTKFSPFWKWAWLLFLLSFSNPPVSAQKAKPVSSLQDLPLSKMRLKVERSDKPIWKITESASVTDPNMIAYVAKSINKNLELTLLSQLTYTSAPGKLLLDNINLLLAKSMSQGKLIETEPPLIKGGEEEPNIPDEAKNLLLECRAVAALGETTAYFRGFLVATAREPHLYRLYLCIARAKNDPSRNAAKTFIDSLTPEFDSAQLQFKGNPQTTALLNTAELWVDGVSLGKASVPHDLPLNSHSVTVSVSLKNCEGTLYEKNGVTLHAGETYPSAPVTLKPPPIIGEVTFLLISPETQILLESEGMEIRHLKQGEAFAYTYPVPEEGRPQLAKINLRQEGSFDRQIYLELGRGKRTVKLPPLQPLPPVLPRPGVPTPLLKPGNFSVTFPDVPQPVTDGFECKLETDEAEYTLHWRSLDREERGKSHKIILDGLIVQERAVLIPNSESLNEGAHYSSLSATVPGQNKFACLRYVIAGDMLYTLKTERKGKPEIDSTTSLFFESFKPVIIAGQTAYLEPKEGKYWLPISLSKIEGKAKEGLTLEGKPLSRAVGLIPRRAIGSEAVGFYRLQCTSYEVPRSLSKVSAPDLLTLCVAGIAKKNLLPAIQTSPTFWDTEFQIASSQQGEHLQILARYRLILNSKKNRLYVLKAEIRPEESDACAVRLFLNQFETE